MSEIKYNDMPRHEAIALGFVPMTRERARQLGGKYVEFRGTFFRAPAFDADSNDEAWMQMMTPEGLLRIKDDH